MTRPIFGKMKTIVIPYFSGEHSLEEYKKLTGVDLVDVLNISLEKSGNDGYIKAYPKPNSLTLLECGDDSFGVNGALNPINYHNEIVWGAGTGDGETGLGYVALDSKGEIYDSFVLVLRISGSDDFSIENLTVGFGEV